MESCFIENHWLPLSPYFSSEKLRSEAKACPRYTKRARRAVKFDGATFLQVLWGMYDVGPAYSISSLGSNVAREAQMIVKNCHNEKMRSTPRFPRKMCLSWFRKWMKLTTRKEPRNRLESAQLKLRLTSNIVRKLRSNIVMWYCLNHHRYCKQITLRFTFRLLWYE